MRSLDSQAVQSKGGARDLATLPLIFVGRQGLAAVSSRTSRLATGAGLVLFVGLATRSRLPIVPLTVAVAVAIGDILLRRLHRGRLRRGLPGTTTVADTETSWGGSTLVARISQSRSVILVTRRLLSVSNLGGLDDTIDLGLLRRVESVEVLRRRRRA